MTEQEAFAFLDENFHISLRDTAEKLQLQSRQVLDLWDIVKPYISAWEAQRKELQHN